MRKISVVVLSALFLTACVSKKKYVALEQDNGELRSELTKTKVEKEDLEAKFSILISPQTFKAINQHTFVFFAPLLFQLKQS